MEEDLLGRFNACSCSSRGVDCSLHLGLPGTQPSSSSQPQVMSPEVCSMCGTTKTPLWRSGPYGPKSLCNACGIRYRKEQRRLALSLGIPSTASTRSSSTTRP